VNTRGELRPLQNDIELVSVIGSETQTAILISAILSDFGRSDSPVVVLGRQIRMTWLPAVEGVDFVRLSDAEAAARTSGCGNYWFVTVENVPRNGDLRVSRQRTCSASVHSMDFALREGEWHQTRTGIGSGWVGGPPPECVACLRLP
jgi:hypothetical protein